METFSGNELDRDQVPSFAQASEDLRAGLRHLAGQDVGVQKEVGTYRHLKLLSESEIISSRGSFGVMGLPQSPRPNLKGQEPVSCKRGSQAVDGNLRGTHGRGPRSVGAFRRLWGVLLLGTPMMSPSSGLSKAAEVKFFRNLPEEELTDVLEPGVVRPS